MSLDPGTDWDLDEELVEACLMNGIDEEEYIAWCRYEGLDPNDQQHAAEFFNEQHEAGL